MKILIIGNCNHQFIYNYVKALREKYQDRKLHIDILSQCEYKESLLGEKLYNHIYSLQLPAFFSRFRILRIILQEILFSIYLKKLQNYDIVHIHYIEDIIIWNILFSYLLRGKLIVSIWGSDFLRASAKKRRMMSRILDRSNQITIASSKVKEEFDSFYKGRYHHKISICEFGLQPLEDIIKIISKDDAKKKFALKYWGQFIDRIYIVVGYNASRLQQHLLIIDSIEKNDNLKKYINNIEFILPCTYPKNESYLNELSNKIKHSTFHYLLMDEFMSNEEIAQLRVCSDIFIQLQPTDMLSGSMLEHLAGGNIVITGSWLPYEKLDELDLYLIKIDQINQIGNQLYDVLSNYEKNKEFCLKNKGIVENVFRWKNVISKWGNVYDKVIV